MRYRAPIHISSISLACGEFEVADGFVLLPDELAGGDSAGLAVHGFHADPSDDDIAAADKARKAQDKADAELAAAIEAEQADTRALEAAAAEQAAIDAAAAASASAAAAIPPPGEGEAGAQDPVGPPAGEPVAVSVVNLGFGKYKLVDANGERFGDVMKKAEAEATGLPIAKA